MPRQGSCGEVNISATRACFSMGEVLVIISAGLRYPRPAGQLAFQHVARDDLHRVAQQVRRVAAEVAQSCDASTSATRKLPGQKDGDLRLFCISTSPAMWLVHIGSPLSHNGSQKRACDCFSYSPAGRLRNVSWASVAVMSGSSASSWW